MTLTTPKIERLSRVLTTPRLRREALALALYERKLRLERARQSRPGGLIHFVRYFWVILEPNREFVDGWALRAMCDHLEAVSRGTITRLLINVPPGSMKSLLCNVFWPAWEWSALGKPDKRYVSFSYAAHLTERDNEKMVDLIKSSRFQDMWGHVFKLKNDGKTKFANNHKGWKFASSVGGVGTGERGDTIVLDDPHNVKEGESEVIREETVRWRRESMMSRLNDMVKSAIVVIMQRVHEGDVSGDIIDNEEPFVHLMIPMEYETGRHCETEIGWSDPRTVEGECFWPERFPPEAVALCKAQGDYAWAGQYQQRPEIRGGGLIKREYWQVWEEPKFPQFDYILASLDPAFTSKEENDPSALTVWGAFRQENGDVGIMLIWSFNERKVLHGPYMEKWTGETTDDYRARCKPTWGLVEHVAEACRRFQVDRLIIEAKASGHSVAQEMARLYGHKGYAIELVDPKNLDKMARAIRVQPMFSGLQVFAPWVEKVGLFRMWAQRVVDQCAIFPRGKHDDLVDSTTQALWWFRQNGFAQRHEEIFAKKDATKRRYKAQQPLYPV
jgi:predicted phage terminase large subunit-like protein